VRVFIAVFEISASFTGAARCALLLLGEQPAKKIAESRMALRVEFLR